MNRQIHIANITSETKSGDIIAFRNKFTNYSKLSYTINEQLHASQSPTLVDVKNQTLQPYCHILAEEIQTLLERKDRGMDMTN